MRKWSEVKAQVGIKYRKQKKKKEKKRNKVKETASGVISNVYVYLYTRGSNRLCRKARRACVAIVRSPKNCRLTQKPLYSFTHRCAILFLNCIFALHTSIIPIEIRIGSTFCFHLHQEYTIEMR